MANEITKEAQENIDKMLSQEAYERAQKDQQPPNNSNVCAVCQCPGGNGMVKMYGAYVPCPACIRIV